MSDLNEQFFQAYWTPGMKMVYTDRIPKEMIAIPANDSGWFEWKLLKGTFTFKDYEKVEERFKVKLPDSFIDWHKTYFFLDGDCSIVRLPYSLPTEPLSEIKKNLEWFPEELLSLGLIPFASEGNDTGPLVFDTRNQTNNIDFPIRVYDHEYGGELDGLSEIIFSSFTKLLECLTHFLNERENKKAFEIIPDFFKIDPAGAGSTGKNYWMSWVEMGKANYEEFGY